MKWLIAGITGVAVAIGGAFLDVFKDRLEGLINDFTLSPAPITFESDITIPRCESGQLASTFESIEKQTSYKFPNNAGRVRICGDVLLDKIPPQHFPAKLVERYPSCFHYDPSAVIGGEVHPVLQVVLTSMAVCVAPFVEGRESGQSRNSAFNPILCIGELGQNAPVSRTYNDHDFTAKPRDCTKDELMRFGWPAPPG